MKEDYRLFVEGDETIDQIFESVFAELDKDINKN